MKDGGGSDKFLKSPEGQRIFSENTVTVKLTDKPVKGIDGFPTQDIFPIGGVTVKFTDKPVKGLDE